MLRYVQKYVQDNITKRDIKTDGHYKHANLHRDFIKSP